jgi:hypothetical protein
MLERQLPRMSAPRFVLYGYIQHHEERNVAHTSWMRSLSSYSRRGHVDLPYATFDEETGLVRHDPERYVWLPFSKSSVLAALTERFCMWVKLGKRLGQKRRVTKEILLKMNTISKAHGAEFIVVLLQADEKTKKQYMGFLRKNRIRFIDCVFDMPRKMRVPGEGHPNGKMNTLWVQRISAVLDELLKEQRPSKPPPERKG